MYQLHNLINRSLVPSDSEKDMNAAEDFMLSLVHSFVTYAGKVFQASSSVTDLAKVIVDKFVKLPDSSNTATSDCTDGVLAYATEVISLGLLWHGFHDAVKEADGERILRYWKFLLIVLKSTRHRNYAKEAVNLLYQYYYVFSQRKRMQLLWSRCTNTRGFPRTNIPCDLYMEHINRRLKSIIRGMGGNLTPERIQKASYSIATVQRA